MTKNQFRAVVGLNVLIDIVSVIAIFTLAPALPPELESWMSQQADTPYGAFEWIVTALAAAYVVATIGLFFFARWSRAVYAVTAIAVMISTLFAGPSVATALDNFSNEAVLLLDGAIIALAYFSNVRHHFEPHAQPA
jgi:hypothetical protein